MTKTAKQSRKAKPVAELSWAALARGLGVERNTVSDWRDNRPDAPKERTVEAWRAYMIANNLGQSGSPAARESREVKLDQIKLENKLLSVRIAKEERKLIPRDEVRALLFSLSTSFNSTLGQLFETELPPKLDGMSAVQMRPILRTELDALREKMADAVKDFESR